MGYVPLLPPPSRKTKIFYRYIRPLKVDSRFELRSVTRGGICLRFEDDGNRLWFSYSRCHPEDDFNSKVAKAIADSRAEMIRGEPLHLERQTLSRRDISSDDLPDFVIDCCFQKVMPGIVGMYVDRELQQLAQYITKLLKQNFDVRQEHALRVVAIEALNTQKRYKDKYNEALVRKPA